MHMNKDIKGTPQNSILFLPGIIGNFILSIQIFIIQENGINEKREKKLSRGFRVFSQPSGSRKLALLASTNTASQAGTGLHELLGS